MNSARKQLADVGWRLRTAGVLVLGVFVFGLALTHFESLHHWLHPDAQGQNHHCFVTLLAAGQIDLGPAPVSLQPASSGVCFFSWPDTPVLQSFACFLPHGRGPPALIA